MLNNTGRKVKVIGYTQTQEPRKVAFIYFYRCEKCNDFPLCRNPINCKFVEYISTRLPRDQVNYSCDNNTPILRLDLPTTDAREHAHQIMLRAQKLRTNRIFVKGKIK